MELNDFDLSSLAYRARKILDLVRGTVEQWQKDKVPRLAAALAFFAVLSMPSALVLAIMIAGQFIGQQDAQQVVLSQSQQILDPASRAVVSAVLEAATRPQSFSVGTALSVIFLFFGASGVFVHFQDALNTIYGVKSEPGQLALVRKRAFSYLLVLGLGLLLAAILLVNSLVAFLGDFIADLLPGSLIWMRVLDVIASFTLLEILISLIFKVVPDVDIAWMDVAIGAAVTSVLSMIGIFTLGFYFQYADPRSAFGVAGSLIALLIWAYYSAQIFLVGAEFTKEYAEKYGDGIAPKDGAIRLSAR